MELKDPVEDRDNDMSNMNEREPYNGYDIKA